MRMFLEPTEALLFRTSRPFDAGEGGYAESIFPPTPETLQGALRAAIAVHWDQTKTLDELFRQPKLVQLIGDRTGYGQFRITGLALGRRKDKTIERLFPAPAHLLQDKEGKLRLKPASLENVQSNMPPTMQLLSPDRETDGKLKPVGGWLTEQALQQALNRSGDLTSLGITHNHDIYEIEPRVGIGMQNKTKTTEEGLLYQVHMIRMKPDYGFVIDIRLSQSSDGRTLVDDGETQTLLHLLKEGWVTLGGERRAARFEILDSSGQKDNTESAKAGTLVYLATPACFDGGWQPLSWPAPLTTPIAAAINRYQPIGGWLLNPGNGGGESKSIRRCVPAGSVYFFEKPVPVTQPLTDYGWQIGYGMTFIGE